MKSFSKYLALAAIAIAMPVSAQTIDFESNNGYSRLGVYDTWEQSPFRTGAIASQERYVGITDNPNTEIDEIMGIQPNPSAKVLAVQRSRFGSNTFGARIDLTDTLRLGTATRYVHVMILKPEGETSGVMVIGLGKRRNWEAQSPETEQFWETTSANIEDGKWTDLVFPITTNENVDIHSLVIVPDLASPHIRNSDFVAYIDNIEVDDNPRPRILTTFYPVNFDTEQSPTRTDRSLNSITINATGEKTQSITINKNRVYNNQVETKTITAKPGSTINVKMSYTGRWMSGYAYVDWDNDGQFKPVIVGNVPAAGSELASYTHLSGYNSLGQTANGNDVNNGTLTCPAFKIPADTPFGVYRMRLKVDWNSEDPGGNLDASNLLVNNGGAVVDVLLNVHDENVSISANQLNGDVLAADGTALSDKPIPFGQACKVKAVPAPGFTYTGIVLTHGYNLDGPQYAHGNKQFDVETIPASSFDANNEYSIPSSKVNGEVRIEGLFTPGPTAIYSRKTYETDLAITAVYDLNGRRVENPAKGIYISNGKRIMVK